MFYVSLRRGLFTCTFFSLITCHYYAYANVYILMHLSVVEFASVGLAVVLFTLRKGAGVPENYVL